MIDVTRMTIEQIEKNGGRVLVATKGDLPGKTVNDNPFMPVSRRVALGRAFRHSNGTVYYTVSDGYYHTPVIVTTPAA